MPQSPDAVERNKPRLPPEYLARAGRPIYPADVLNLAKFLEQGFQDLLVGPAHPTDEPVEFLGAQLNRGALHFPVAGGALEGLGTVGGGVTGLFGIPALFSSEESRNAAALNYRTLEGDEPGFFDLPAYSRALNAARESRAGELGRTAESESLPLGERGTAALGQFLYGGLPNFAPIKPALRVSGITGRAANALPEALESTVGKGAPGAGIFEPRTLQRVTARSTAESAAAKALREAEDAYREKYIKVPEGTVIDEAARTRDLYNIDRLTKAAAQEAKTGVEFASTKPRYVPEVGKTRSVVKDTETGETLPQIFMGENHAADAAAEAARREAMVQSSQSAIRAAEKVVPKTNTLRDLTTPQLTALRATTDSPTDRALIDALLGERAFAMAPKDQVAMAANIFDRDVATNIRRSLRGIDSDLTGVEAAIDKALTESKVPLTPANRAAVLQKVIDEQTAANIRNPAVNAARRAGKGGGGDVPPPAPPVEPPPAPIERHGVARQVFESIRTLKSFIDLPLGRQGIRAIGNPVAFGKGAVASLRAYKGGPKVVTNWLAEKEADDLFQLSVKKGGVEYTSPEAGSVVGRVAREEAYPGGVVEQVPILGGAIQHSNAAFTHSLNVIRYEKFKSDLAAAEWLWKHLFRQKIPLPDSEIAAVGRGVNVATGRGQLGAGGAISKELGTAFFSPRNTISWVQFFTDWIGHIKAGNKTAALIHAKTLGTYLGAAITFLKAKEVLGEQVEWDPRSSDFMKVVNGDQRIDFMGGGQQWMVALARIASGQTKSLSGEVTPTSLNDVFGAFLLNRTHPALGTIEESGRLAFDTVRRGLEGKPFTGTTKDPFGNEYGAAEVFLGAAAPIIVEQFINSLRFEMEKDKTALEAATEAAKDFAISLGGVSVDRYRPGLKVPPIGGELGSSTPEKPRGPEQILLSGALQKQRNEAAEKAREAAIAALIVTPAYQNAPEAEKARLHEKAAADASRVASKMFGLNLALNGSPDESRDGAAIAFQATTSNFDRARLAGLLSGAGKVTSEMKALIDSKRRQTDPTLPDYDLSFDDYLRGSQLVERWLAAPQFIEGTREQWVAAAKGAEMLRKLIADDVRRGVNPSDDPHRDDLYYGTPYLSQFYTKAGSRISKLVHPVRQSIESDLLWPRFEDGARKAETP